MKTLYVCQYGCIDFEESTFSYLTDEIELAIESEKKFFAEMAEECDMENFKIESGRDENGTYYVHLVDEQGQVTEWKDFTVGKIQSFGAK